LAGVTGRAIDKESLSTARTGGPRGSKAEDKTVPPEHNAPDMCHGKYQEKVNVIAYVREHFSEKVGKKDKPVRQNRRGGTSTTNFSATATQQQSSLMN